VALKPRDLGPGIPNETTVLTGAGWRHPINGIPGIVSVITVIAAATVPGVLQIRTADPSPLVDDTAWFVRDGGSPQSVVVRFRIGGVTHEAPLFTLP